MRRGGQKTQLGGMLPCQDAVKQAATANGMFKPRAGRSGECNRSFGHTGHETPHATPWQTPHAMPPTAPVGCQHAHASGTDPRPTFQSSSEIWRLQGDPEPPPPIYRTFGG